MTDARAWTVFDPNLRIETYDTETMHRVVVTHLPTGLQETCGEYPHQAQNQAAAIARLRTWVP